MMFKEFALEIASGLLFYGLVAAIFIFMFSL